MIARIGKFRDDDSLCCYMLGYVSARMFRLPDHPSGGGRGEGVPVCIAATQVQAVNFVLPLTPLNYSYDYHSAVLHGYAELRDPVTDHDESLWAMELITDGIVLQWGENTRILPDDTEIASTTQRDLFY